MTDHSTDYSNENKRDRGSRRDFLRTTGAGIAVASVAGCLGGGGDGGSGLTIGFYGPFSGPASNIGEQKQIAAEMSRDMINEDGGVHGQDIELVFGDSESQPSAGRNEVNRLIQQENVDAIGGDSTVTSRSQQSRSPPNRELHRSLMRQSERDRNQN